MNIFDTLIVQPIFNLLVVIYSVIPGADFGVAIIIFTVIIRFLLYPLTRSMLHQTKAMRKLQPELVKIKKRAKGNRQVAAMQQMELYKKHSINPFRSIGILLIQLPIFISLYYAIQIFTVNRDQIQTFTYGFLENLGAIRTVIENPDQFSENLFGVIELARPAIQQSGLSLVFLVVLAFVAAYTQYIISKQTAPQDPPKKRLRDIMAEAAEGKEADQAEMNAVVMGKMIKFLPIFMFFIMISLPGALALYYAVSNIVAVLQQSYLLRQDKEEMLELSDMPEKKQPAKKATAKARTKTATEATVTRVVATPPKSKSKKKGRK